MKAVNCGGLMKVVEESRHIDADEWAVQQAINVVNMYWPNEAFGKRSEAIASIAELLQAARGYSRAV